MPKAYQSTNILATLPRNGDAVLLYTPPQVVYGVQTAKFDGTIEGLTAVVKIQSLPEMALPNFELEDDQSKRFNEVRNLQYRNARFELQLLLSKDGGATKTPIAAVQLMNMQRSGFVLDLLNAMASPVSYRVGFGVGLWAKINNVGYGFPTASDSIVIHGPVNEEAYTTTEEVNTLGVQRHTAITLLGLRAANLAEAIENLIETWDGRIQVVVNNTYNNTYQNNITNTGGGGGGGTVPTPTPTITSAIFEAIRVENGDVVVIDGNVAIEPSRLPSGVSATLLEAIVTSGGAVVTSGGNVVVNPSLIPVGVNPGIFDKIVVSDAGSVVTQNDRVVYTP